MITNLWITNSTGGKAFGILTLQKDQICSVPPLFLSFWTLQKDTLFRSMAPFVLLNAPKGRLLRSTGSFCLFECSKRTICSGPRVLLSFWILQKDILLRFMAPFVLLNAPKEQFAPVHEFFCPFEYSKRTFCSGLRLLLSFWMLQKDNCSSPVTPFVLLNASLKQQ